MEWLFEECWISEKLKLINFGIIKEFMKFKNILFYYMHLTWSLYIFIQIIQIFMWTNYLSK